MLNRNENRNNRLSLTYQTHARTIPFRERFNQGCERNLFRKGLPKNLHSDYNQVEDMAKTLRRITDTFDSDKIKLKDEILKLKETTDGSNKRLGKFFRPEIKALMKKLSVHQKSQIGFNRALEVQIQDIGVEFENLQGSIDQSVRSLNDIDDAAGVETNFF